MYGVAYDTGRGFGSVGLVGDLREERVLVGDPVLGTRWVEAEDCYHVLWTEGPDLLPFTYPVVGSSERTPWLDSEDRAPMAANVEQLRLEGFVTGYPIAYERVRFWREGLVPDWRTVALIMAFCIATAGTRTTSAHKYYAMFAPVLRDLFEEGAEPTPGQLRRLPGFRSLGLAALRSKGIAELPEYSTWLVEQMEDSNDYTRRFRNMIAREPVPAGLGLAKLTFSLALLGRDGACLDRRILYQWLGKEKGIKAREQFESKTAEGSFSALTLGRYNKLEERLRGGRWWDPAWPMPYAKAQWTMWESLGRPPGPEDHATLWKVLGL
jgi:hypothetical protein